MQDLSCYDYCFMYKIFNSCDGKFFQTILSDRKFSKIASLFFDARSLVEFIRQTNLITDFSIENNKLKLNYVNEVEVSGFDYSIGEVIEIPKDEGTLYELLRLGIENGYVIVDDTCFEQQGSVIGGISSFCNVRASNSTMSLYVRFTVAGEIFNRMIITVEEGDMQFHPFYFGVPRKTEAPLEGEALLEGEAQPGEDSPSSCIDLQKMSLFGRDSKKSAGDSGKSYGDSEKSFGGSEKSTGGSEVFGLAPNKKNMVDFRKFGDVTFVCTKVINNQMYDVFKVNSAQLYSETTVIGSLINKATSLHVRYQNYMRALHFFNSLLVEKGEPLKWSGGSRNYKDGLGVFLQPTRKKLTKNRIEELWGIVTGLLKETGRPSDVKSKIEDSFYSQDEKYVLLMFLGIVLGGRSVTERLSLSCQKLREFESQDLCVALFLYEIRLNAFRFHFDFRQESINEESEPIILAGSDEMNQTVVNQIF